MAHILAETMYLRDRGGTLSHEQSMALLALTDYEAAKNKLESLVVVHGKMETNLALDDESVAIGVLIPAAVTRFLDAQRVWDVQAAILLAHKKTPAVRRGKRKTVSVPTLMELPTTEESIHAMITLINPIKWTAHELNQQIISESSNLHLDLSPEIGLDTTTAITTITRHGASVLQTFLALANIWKSQCESLDPETYLEAYASDVLRYQGRKQTPKGGYHQADTLAKGRDIFLLSRLTVVSIQPSETGFLTLSRFISVEQLQTELSNDATESVVRFRYHLGQIFHGWLQNDSGMFTRVSAKLLSYHPKRQKYHILLGICIAHILWTRQHTTATHAVVPLSEVLRMANLTDSNRRPGAFLSAIEDALIELSRDGIFPGISMKKPSNWTSLSPGKQAREILDRSIICLDVT